MGLSFTIAAGPRQRSHSLARIPRNSWPHFIVSDSRPPNLEGQVPVFIFSRNRVARLYPQALGPLFVVSYDSQGYDKGIQIRLRTRRTACKAPCPTVSQVMCIRCRGNVFTEPLSRNIRRETQAHRQQGDLISLLLVFFKIRKVGQKYFLKSQCSFIRKNTLNKLHSLYPFIKDLMFPGDGPRQWCELCSL
jgi:hypothetical protein